MKRIILTTVLVCCTLSLAAQETIRVNYKGAKPTISDFATAFLSVYEWNDDSEDVLDEARNAMKNTWLDYLKGEKLLQNEKLTVDQKNGYICYEYNGDGYQQTTEMCYWNEADGQAQTLRLQRKRVLKRHHSPGQSDGLIFYRYDNATKKMTYCDAPGFDEIYGTDDGAFISYSLPRTGKDIIYTEWRDNGKKKQKTLKWNGRKFSF